VVNGRSSSLRVTRCFYCTSPLEQLFAEAVKVVNTKNAQKVLDKLPE
jgi:DNA-directed RNA polymerase subunit N (RpoN/RPB10)